MRCKACNKRLSDAELMRKTRDKETGKDTFLDLCGKCFDQGNMKDSYESRQGTIHVDISRARI